MKNPKFWLAVLVAGIVVNILDMIVMGMMVSPIFEGIESMNPSDESKIIWYVLGDFVAIFVFMLVYDRVYSSFTPGPGGGATFGLYGGLLVGFPTWIFIQMMFKGFPYGLAWGMVFYSLIWGAIAGAVMGAMYKKKI